MGFSLDLKMQGRFISSPLHSILHFIALLGNRSYFKIRNSRYALSRTMAIPCPPPMQSVARPRFAFFFWSCMARL